MVCCSADRNALLSVLSSGRTSCKTHQRPRDSGSHFYTLRVLWRWLTTPLLKDTTYWLEIKSTWNLSPIKSCTHVLKRDILTWQPSLAALWLGIYCAPKPFWRALLLWVVQLGALHPLQVFWELLSTTGPSCPHHPLAQVGKSTLKGSSQSRVLIFLGA